MHRLLILTSFFLVFTTSTSQAQTSQTIENAFDAGNGHAPGEKGTGFTLAKIDRGIVKEFSKAWQQVGLGTMNTEAVVLILRNPDGSYKAASCGITNQSYKFSFTWDPATVAVVHTHPNTRNPQPHGADLPLADRFGVPVLTITNKGMFMYDPVARQITKVHKGLDWLRESRWSEQQYLAANKN